MAKKNINQKAIAESLNLSVATVSKALSDYSDVNSETRAKVVNMASKLGYSGIRSLKLDIEETQKTKSALLGVFVMHGLYEMQPVSFFAGMSEKCAKLNVSLVFHYVNKDNCQEILDPACQPPAMREGRLSGLVLVNNWPEKIVQQLSSKLPCVSILNDVPAANIDVVGIDDVHGISLLIDHLYQKGHRKIGFFGRCGRVHWSRRRLGGYVDSLCRLNLIFTPESVCDLSAEHLEDKAFEVNWQIDKVCKQIERGFRGWVCASDWAGYLLCRELLNRGYRIPKDVSVTGFDASEDNTFGCAKLTSTILPAQNIGAEALRRLILRMRYPSAPRETVAFRCSLFNGETTGPVTND